MEARSSHHRLLLALMITGFLTGCGSDQIPTWPTSGRVVFADGSPVMTGIIELQSDAHELTATGRIQPDGSFVLGTYETDDGAVAGSHRVIVLQLVINDGTINHTMDHGDSVDSKFATYESSELVATVEEIEQNNLTIEVTAQ